MIRNPILDNFGNWMTIHRNLSSSSVEKYARAVNTISNDMLDLGVINESLLNMGLTELDLSIALILSKKKTRRLIKKHFNLNLRCFF